jgi:hypothetical protein
MGFLIQHCRGRFQGWFAKDLSVYSFGTLASYAAAVAEDSRRNGTVDVPNCSWHI